ncbi:MAG TPA: polysaccharide biosynthesis tyrosine autokinase [Planctomycetota bacterium]|nr:polysaccharide biosynthesis tyrosine autokinase [Planctomycetota bacterium]
MSDGAARRKANSEAWDLREILGIVRSRKWPFLGSSFSIIVLVALVTFAMRPVYRATCLLLIEPKGMNVAKVEGVYDPIMAGMALNDYYRTQFEILKARRIVEPAAVALGVPDRQEFRSERDPIEAFTNTVSVEPIRESRLVRVSVESFDKDFATAAANAIVEQFVSENSERTLGLSDTGLKKLKEMERSLRPKYEGAARALQEFKDSNSIYFLDESQSIAVQQLKVLSEELSKAKGDRARAAAESKTVTTDVKDVDGTQAELMPSRALDDLKVELARVEEERDDILKHYTSDHPAAKAAEARVQRVRHHFENEQKALVATVTKKLETEDQRVRELEAAVSKAEERVAEIGRKGVRLQFLKEEADTIATSYKNVARRIEEVEVAIATGTKENNLFVVDRALTPRLPVRPRKTLNVAGSVVFGFLFAFAFVLLLEYLDQTIKGKEDAERLLGYPLLGFVPRVDEAETQSPEGRVPIELAGLHRPRGAVAEAFRSIRTGLGFTLPATRPAAIVITSAAPGDGKSFVSVNLACSLAQTGKRILLIDADLRRPRLHDIFSVRLDLSGLSTALAPGREPSLDGIVSTICPGLDLMPAGPLPPNPAEILGGPSLRAVLDKALALYDWVLLDAPPLTVVADPSIILAQVPHAIFVVRAFATLKGAAQQARELLDKAPGAVAGVVLNTADVPSGKSHAYGYGGYYYPSYHSDRPTHAVSPPT